MIQIAPSMLSADFLHLEKDVEMVNGCADIFHLDIMDGVLVPNSYRSDCQEGRQAYGRPSDDSSPGKIF